MIVVKPTHRLRPLFAIVLCFGCNEGAVGAGAVCAEGAECADQSGGTDAAIDGGNGGDAQPGRPDGATGSDGGGPISPGPDASADAGMPDDDAGAEELPAVPCPLSPREATVGLWCFEEGDGSASAELSGSAAPEASGIAKSAWDPLGGIHADSDKVKVADAEPLDLVRHYSVEVALRVRALPAKPAVATVLRRGSDSGPTWIEIGVAHDGAVTCATRSAVAAYTVTSDPAVIETDEMHVIRCERMPDGSLGLSVDGDGATAAESGSPLAAVHGIDEPLRLGGAEGLEATIRAVAIHDERPGYLFFSSNGSGTAEVWAVRDTGGDGIRVTDGMSGAPTDDLWRIDYSPQANRLAFAGPRDGSDTFVALKHLWTVDPDGTDPQHVVVASSGSDYYGHSWLGGGTHIVYSVDTPCSNDLWRVEASTGAAEVIYDVAGIAVEPSGHPSDPNLVLYRKQMCGTYGSVRLLDIAGMAPSQIPGTVDDEGRFSHVRYSRAGTHFAYANGLPGGGVFVHDFASERLVVEADELDTTTLPVFGNDDRYLYAYWTRDSWADRDFAVIDLQSGTLRELMIEVAGVRTNTTNLRGRGHSWARLDEDIDRDGDLLANGIDPTPDGPLPFVSDGDTLGLWHFDETGGTAVADSGPNGLHGQRTGGAWVEGRIDGGLDMAGDADLVRMPTSELYFPVDAITIEAWIFPRTGSDPGLIWDVQNTQTLLYSAGQVQFDLRFAGAVVTTAGLAAANTWHHVAGSYDGSHIRLYIDGVRVDEKAQSGPMQRAGQCEDPAVGSFCKADGGWFDGIIDELRVSSTARYTGATIPQ